VHQRLLKQTSLPARGIEGKVHSFEQDLRDQSQDDGAADKQDRADKLDS
jgi:hypothetical protein